MKSINVLSCFDGISAGRLALERSGIDVGVYYRSEVDKFANRVALHHYPNDIQLGDVTKWRDWNIDWSSIDLLIGGSPCQGFSLAGKQAGTKAILNGVEFLVTSREKYIEMKDAGATFLSQSHLFWEYVLILDHIRRYNPDVKFLLENVKMKKELLEMIDQAVGVKSVVINSNLVSAQNRHRHYWCNWELVQPADRGILLKTVLEGIPVGYGGAIRGRYNADGTISQKLECNGSEKSNTITTVQKDSVVVCHPCEADEESGVGQLDSAVRWRPASIVGRRLNASGVREDYNKELKVTQVLQVKHNTDKASCLTTVQKDNVLSSSPSGRYIDIYNRDDVFYRNLTPTECARLQTFPDGWAESVISNSQAYKAYGNSWTVDVIAHILSCMKEENQTSDIY